MKETAMYHNGRYFTALLTVLLLAGMAGAEPPKEAWFPQAPPLAKPDGGVIHVSNVEDLYRAAAEVKPDGTIMLADGHYMMPRYFQINTDGVTLRSASGNRDRVVLDGAGSRHGELLAITRCQGVTIADLTVQNVKWNGIKINSNVGTDRTTIYNCVIHNVWQRGIKAPAVPEDQQQLSPRDCRIQFCLFYNDRAKQFWDDETDTPETFNGNYIGGIDVKNTVGWSITDNVFIGIQGRTREGRGCIYISENGRDCLIERNIFIDCDIAIALGNPSLGYSPLQAIGCIARNNYIAHCPETGILACYTRDCQILNNTIFDPESRQGRLIWVQKSDEGLQVRDNMLIGPPIQITSPSEIAQSGNVVHGNAEKALAKAQVGVGQSFLSVSAMQQAARVAARRQQQMAAASANRLTPGIQSPEVIEAMRRVHQGFEGQAGYVAQFGDSITYSMAFWSPIGWDEPQKFLLQEDDLPAKPADKRWRDIVKGTRDKGPKFANYSGWRVGQLLRAIDAVLEREKPEAAIIMVGTNDISGGRVPDSYREDLEQVVNKCLEAHCVPILNTIPPRRDRGQAVEETNKIIRDVAGRLHVPLADFHAECLRLRPGNSWDGTIMAQDGVHPSGGKTNVYTDENMRSCGYALRTWINFLVLRQIYFRVFEPISGDATDE